MVSISVTKVFPYPKNKIVSNFTSIDNLVDTCIASMYVPLWTEKMCLGTLLKGSWTVDGGFTLTVRNVHQTDAMQTTYKVAFIVFL